METAWKAGLEDVIAARSAICQVDGVNGRLYYRGYEIGDLAGAVSFEDVTALLWHGELPDAAASARVHITARGGARSPAGRGRPAPDPPARRPPAGRAPDRGVAGGDPRSRRAIERRARPI